MLEKIDLDKKVKKEEYGDLIDDLASKLAVIQRSCKENNIPIIILFEGWGSSGKGTLINRLIGPLDPRGFKVFTTCEATKEEELHPFLWRFWTKTPEKGRIHIFDRSWYQRVTTNRIDGVTSKEELNYAYNELVDFEEQLTVEGTVIIKLFLHISKKEQKRRFQELEENPVTKWRVTKKDWKHNNLYEEYVGVYDEMIAKTDSSFAPWHIIESNDTNYATVKIMKVVIQRLSQVLEQLEQHKKSVKEDTWNDTYQDDQRFQSGVLASVDVSKDMTKKEYKERLKDLQSRLSLLHNEMYLKRIPVILAFEGWDAAGKGGAIKRLTQSLDPRGYEVVPISAPNDIERAHHYLWRFWNHFPKAGHMTIFDRTWYGRVLVERVEGFCSHSQWNRAYSEINHMEEHLTNAGYIVIKFWLHIDKDEQERRFLARQEDPKKQWKITDEDWRNREKWDLYEVAVDDMIIRTSTKLAPWVIVEANNKLFARIKVLETVVDALEARLKDL